MKARCADCCKIEVVNGVNRTIFSKFVIKIVLLTTSREREKECERSFIDNQEVTEGW
jgi:hypothetical protein